MKKVVTNQNNAETSSSKKLENHSDDNDPQNIAAHSSIQHGEEPPLIPSTYHIPVEDRAASSHTFTSDIDQQKMIKELRSEVAILREDLKSLSKRIEKLENK
jgi:hypothetical protein